MAFVNYGDSSSRRVSEPFSEAEMDYSPEGGEDGDISDIKRERGRKDDGKREKRGVINRVNRTWDASSLLLRSTQLICDVLHLSFRLTYQAHV